MTEAPGAAMSRRRSLVDEGEILFGVGDGLLGDRRNAFQKKKSSILPTLRFCELRRAAGNTPNGGSIYN
jgi:hypothetical protein